MNGLNHQESGLYYHSPRPESCNKSLTLATHFLSKTVKIRSTSDDGGPHPLRNLNICDFERKFGKEGG